MLKSIRRIAYLLRQARARQDLAEEMAAHREMMPEDRREAFGNGLRLQEQSRAASGWMGLDRFRQDLMHAARVLWRSPGFTLTAVAVLALGIGANLTEFHIFYAATMRRFPIRDARSIARFIRLPVTTELHDTVPSAEIEYFREHARSFSYFVTESDSAVTPRSILVSPNYFADLGVRPERGRLLDPRDSLPGSPAVAVLGYAYWKDQFHGDLNVVGHTIVWNGTAIPVVGITPPDFDGLTLHRTQLWLPATAEPALSARLSAKLRSGVSVAAAAQELTGLEASLNRSVSFRGDFLQPSLSLDVLRGQPTLRLTIVFVLLVLLSACANLGSLLIARGIDRAPEIRVRIALGASRGRIVRQLMTENLFLAALGSAAALGVGQLAAKSILYWMGAPAEIHIATDWPLVMAGAVLGLLSALTFGLAPAIQVLRRPRRGMWIRPTLVAAQAAIGCALLILSALLSQSSDKGGRNVAMLIGLLGATATLLAAIGIAGVTAFVVAQRTREIGLRVALGAHRFDILRTLSSQHALPLLAGASAGSALAWAVIHILRTAERGIRIPDPLKAGGYATGLAIFGLAAFAAVLIPAIRAMRISPSTALRSE